MRLRSELEALIGKPGARITVIRSGGLGDTILLLPTLQLLREALPKANLTLVGSEWAEAIVPLLPFALQLARFDSMILAPLFGGKIAEDPTGLFSPADAVILYTADPSSGFAVNIKRLCGGPVVTWPVMPTGDRHAALHFARAAVERELPLGDLPAPILRAPSDLDCWARAWLTERSREDAGPVAVHPGSGGRRKCWPAECFAEAARGLGGPILVIEGPADAEPAAEVARRLDAETPQARAAGLSLPQLAALLTRCRLYVGNDSGVTHLAASLGIPTVAVFGPTDPTVWAPLGPHATAAKATPGGAWPTPGEVVATIQELLR